MKQHRRGKRAGGTSSKTAIPAAPAEGKPITRKSRWSLLGKAGIAFASLIVAWAVPFFAPSVWQGISDATGREQLLVTVLEASDFQSEAHALHSGRQVIPRSLSEVQRVPASERAAWQRSVGAVDAESTLIRLIIRGTSDRRVTIQRVSVEVTRRDVPLTGLVISGDSGGVADPRYLRADLDTGDVRWSDADGSPIGPSTVFVTDRDEELLDLIAFTKGGEPNDEGCDCRWLVRLTYTVEGGEVKHLLVGPEAGGTFRTTAVSRAADWNVSTGTCTDVPSLPVLCDADPTRGRG